MKKGHKGSYGAGKKSGGKKAGHGAGLGYAGATGPGGDSKSKPVKKGPYAPR